MLKRLASRFKARLTERRLRARGLRSSGSPKLVLSPYSEAESSDLRVKRIAPELEALGWHTTVLPPHLGKAARQRIVAAIKPDAILLQKARHSLNTPEVFPDYPCILDLDDADFLVGEATAPGVASATTRVAGLCQGVICGSSFIETWARKYCANTCVVWTGTPTERVEITPHDSRSGHIVTWAQAQPLRYPKEFDEITSILLRTAQIRPGFTVRFYGWNAKDTHPNVDRLRQAGLTVETMASMSYDAFVDSLSDVSVGLSFISPHEEFSQGKSFGKILAYVSAGVPVICSDAVDHGRFFDQESGVVSNDPEVWAKAIVDMLESPALRQDMAVKAAERLKKELTTKAAAGKVADFVGGLISGDRKGPVLQ